jgi:hypothetical protein
MYKRKKNPKISLNQYSGEGYEFPQLGFRQIRKEKPPQVIPQVHNLGINI